MSADSMLFHVDNIVVDGRPISFEDGSASLSGAAGYENEVVPSAQGRDFARRRRVPRQLRLRLQFGNDVDPDALARANGVQIAIRDTKSGRRALLNDCVFGSLGDLGAGSVDLTYHVMSPIQWL